MHGKSITTALGIGWTRILTSKAREREREDLKGKRKLGIVIQSYKVGFPIHENVTPKPNPKSIYFFFLKFNVQLSLFQWVRNHGT